MKYFLHFLLFIISFIMILGCEKNNIDDLSLKVLIGKWEIENNEGIIEFKSDESFYINSNRGNLINGNYSSSLKYDEILVTWLEYENNDEYLPVTDNYPYIIKILDYYDNTLEISNLPLYIDKKNIKLYKK